MLKFIHLQMIVRLWIRRALSSTISLISLAIGILLSSILILFVVNEYRTATAFDSDGELYVIEHKNQFIEGGNERSRSVEPRTAVAMKSSFPEIKEALVFMETGGSWGGENEKKIQDNAFEVFQVYGDLCGELSIPVLEGDLRRTLSSPNEVALTSTFARRLTGKENPLGENVELSRPRYIPETGGMGFDTFQYTITTLLEETDRLPLRYHGFYGTNVTPEFGGVRYGRNYSILKLQKGTDPKKLLAKIAADSSENKLYYKDHFLTKLSDVYFTPTKESESLYYSRDKSTLTIGLVIAIAILVISVFNYINLTLVRAPQRIKSLAGQRIMGASKWSTYWQTILDTAFNIFVALVIVSLLMQPALEQFNSFMGSSLKVGDFFVWNSLQYMLLLIITLIALPSLYIITKMEISRPLDMFMHPRMGRAKVVRTMVIAQFVISVILVATGINIARQIDYITAPLPNTESIVVVHPNFGGDERTEFMDFLKSQPYVLSSTGSIPFSMMSMVSNGVLTNVTYIDSTFFSFYGIKIVDGRNIKISSDGESSDVVVNQAYLQSRNKTSMIGETVELQNTPSTIVGVCQDFMERDAKIKAQPTVYAVIPGTHKNWSPIVLKLQGSVDQRLKDLEKAQTKVIKDSSATVKYIPLQENYKNANAEAIRMKKMVSFFMIVSLLLTCFGMFGISWYTVMERRKEIALRKIHGSSTSTLIALLCRSFFMWVAIASIIALPASWWLTSKWLQEFAYKVDNSIWVMIVTIVIIAAVTFVTVIWQTYRAATENPVKSIKAE